MKYKCRAIKSFAIYRDEKNEDCSPLGQLDVQRGGEREPINVNSKPITYILNIGYGYSKQALDDTNIICYDIKIYVPHILFRHVLYLYHFCLKYPGGSRLAKII